MILLYVSGEQNRGTNTENHTSNMCKEEINSILRLSNSTSLALFQSPGNQADLEDDDPTLQSKVYAADGPQ